MDPISIIFILWFYILPVIGILAVILGPIIWFFIVPPVARRLTWGRFGSSNAVLLADDSGHAELIVTRHRLPEGVLLWKEGRKRFWALLPRTGKGKTEDETRLKEILTSKFILKDWGKPIWIGYKGKPALVNPLTLALATSNPGGNAPLKTIEQNLDTLQKYAEDELAKKDYERIKEIIEKIREEIVNATKTVKVLNPTLIRTLIPQNYQASQLKAIANVSEDIGREEAGRDYIRMGMGFSLIVAILILGIIALNYILG